MLSFWSQPPVEPYLACTEMGDPIFVVLTISDSCHQKTAEDTSGPCLKNLILETFETKHTLTEIIPDDKNLIEYTLCKYSDKFKACAIFTTGGTGFSPRDFTPEATRQVIHKECPQLTLAMSLESFKKTPFAALSRAICGIRYKTLIINFPGSLKAVRECFDAIKTVLPHALQLLRDDLKLVKKTHQEIQQQQQHICPHKTNSGNENDRNSSYPMLPVKTALEIIFETIQPKRNLKFELLNFESPIDIPPFRASIKDGYAVKSSSLSGVKKVIGYIAAGDPINMLELKDDECFKINTGAAIPNEADCVIQIEDTKLLKTKSNGLEDLVEILLDPKPNLDIRQIGCDLKKGSKVFSNSDTSDVVIKSLMASVGKKYQIQKPRIGIISTGNELLCPNDQETDGKIFDSNTTMLEELLKYFSFECSEKNVVSDDFESVKNIIANMFKKTDFIICTGGVSMGDKDYIKPVLMELGFEIKFGRVNVKPGKPMTFATNGEKYFFGLPGNPVSAFVTFHIFTLPAIRWASGFERTKCELTIIPVIIENEKIPLDPRPEYVRASCTLRRNQFFASVTGNQMSSRLQSIIGADVLLHLPSRTDDRQFILSGESMNAYVLRYDFISKYE